MEKITRSMLERLDRQKNSKPASQRCIRWLCVQPLPNGSYCGHEIWSNERPSNIHWTDGHVCKFVENVKS